MKKLLIVVDCQKDFIDGALGSYEAQDMIPRLEKKLEELDNETTVIFTADTHYEDYLDTFEGKKLPVPHCVQGSDGWAIDPRLTKFFNDSPVVVEKETFGSFDLIDAIHNISEYAIDFDEIELVGLCTDICVISNALILRAAFPETEILIDPLCCAGSSVDAHKAALRAMESCQITIK